MPLTPQIRPSPPDKRGLGLTFLGMMNEPEPSSDKVYVTKMDYEMAFGILHRRIAVLERSLLSHLLHNHRPWYRKLWIKVKAFFKGERNEQDEHLGDKHPTVAFHRNRSSEHRGQHGD